MRRLQGAASSPRGQSAAFVVLSALRMPLKQTFKHRELITISALSNSIRELVSLIDSKKTEALIHNRGCQNSPTLKQSERRTFMVFLFFYDIITNEWRLKERLVDAPTAPTATSDVSYFVQM